MANSTLRTLLIACALTLALPAQVFAQGLLDGLKRPTNPGTRNVADIQANYADKLEYQVLAPLRTYLEGIDTDLTGSLQDRTSDASRYAVGHYKDWSAIEAEAWTKQDVARFSLPILVWEQGQPSVGEASLLDFIAELRTLSRGSILGYMVADEKTAYVVIRRPGSREFQILPLSWSTKQMPYLEGYYLPTGVGTPPPSQATVFEPGFLTALKARLGD